MNSIESVFIIFYTDLQLSGNMHESYGLTGLPQNFCWKGLLDIQHIIMFLLPLAARLKEMSLIGK